MDLTKKAMRTRAQAKAKRKRSEAAIIKAVRAAVQMRDETCRVSNPLYYFGSSCEGVLEMAHLGEWRRSHTRGMPPGLRHHTRGCLMLCTRHHRMYDAHEFDLEYGPDGADGSLTVNWVA